MYENIDKQFFCAYNDIQLNTLEVKLWKSGEIPAQGRYCDS